MTVTDDAIAALESVRRAKPNKAGWADLPRGLSVETAKQLERDGLLSTRLGIGLQVQVTAKGAKALIEGGLRP